MSWRMIEAVTYGMIPSAKSENWESAPPEKRLRRPRTVPPWPEKKPSIWSGFTPGAGIQDPSR
jgi:hypothetical protein